MSNRYRHVDELARMGAQIRVSGRVAVVLPGWRRLHGASGAVHGSAGRGGALRGGAGGGGRDPHLRDRRTSTGAMSDIEQGFAGAGGGCAADRGAGERIEKTDIAAERDSIRRIRRSGRHKGETMAEGEDRRGGADEEAAGFLYKLLSMLVICGVSGGGHDAVFPGGYRGRHRGQSRYTEEEIRGGHRRAAGG